MVEEDWREPDRPPAWLGSQWVTTGIIVAFVVLLFLAMLFLPPLSEPIAGGVLANDSNAVVDCVRACLG